MKKKRKYKIEEIDKEWVPQWCFSINDGNVFHYYGIYKNEVVVRGFLSYWRREIHWKLIGEFFWGLKSWYLRKVRPSDQEYIKRYKQYIKSNRTSSKEITEK